MSEKITTTEELEQQLYTLDYIKKNHLIQTSSSKYYGWVAATIEGFEVDEEEDKLKMSFSVPYTDNPSTFSWDLDSLESGGISNICYEFGIHLKDFRLLEGETIWLRLSEIEIEDGEVIDETHWLSFDGKGLKTPPLRSVGSTEYYVSWKIHTIITAILVVIIIPLL